MRAVEVRLDGCEFFGSELDNQLRKCRGGNRCRSAVCRLCSCCKSGSRPPDCRKLLSCLLQLARGWSAPERPLLTRIYPSPGKLTKCSDEEASKNIGKV